MSADLSTAQMSELLAEMQASLTKEQPAVESSAAESAVAEAAEISSSVTAAIETSAPVIEEVLEEAPQSGLTNEESAKIHVVGATEAALKGAKSWDDLPIPAPIRRSILEQGWMKPSRIQETALPLILCDKRNIIAQAQNGSGKTATFSLGMLCSIDANLKAPQALVISPTRELAIQNLEVLKNLGKHSGLSFALVVPQSEDLAAGGKLEAQVISATPGKLEDLLKKRVLSLRSVKIFVLDEADVMVDPANNLGTMVLKSKSQLEKSTQILLFSATFNDQMRRFAESVVPNAIQISVEKKDLTLQTIWQTYIISNDKEKIISDLYAVMNIGQSVIFTNSRNGAFSLAKKLKDDGHAVGLICGTGPGTGEIQIDPAYRDKVISEFRQGVTKVLIATDVLARGIDVPAVTLVVNVDLPPINKGGFETYLHRIGRTGRFGQRGVAINLISSEDEPKIRAIETYYGNKIEKIDADIETLEAKMKEIQTNRKLF